VVVVVTAVRLLVLEPEPVLVLVLALELAPEMVAQPELSSVALLRWYSRRLEVFPATPASLSATMVRADCQPLSPKTLLTVNITGEIVDAACVNTAADRQITPSTLNGANVLLVERTFSNGFRPDLVGVQACVGNNGTNFLALPCAGLRDPVSFDGTNIRSASGACQSGHDSRSSSLESKQNYLLIDPLQMLPRSLSTRMARPAPLSVRQLSVAMPLRLSLLLRRTPQLRHLLLHPRALLKHLLRLTTAPPPTVRFNAVNRRWSSTR